MNDRVRVRVLPVPLPEFSGTGIPAGNTRTRLYPLPDFPKKSGTRHSLPPNKIIPGLRGKKILLIIRKKCKSDFIYLGDHCGTNLTHMTPN